MRGEGRQDSPSPSQITQGQDHPHGSLPRCPGIEMQWAGGSQDKCTTIILGEYPTNRSSWTRSLEKFPPKTNTFLTKNPARAGLWILPAALSSIMVGNVFKDCLGTRNVKLTYLYIYIYVCLYVRMCVCIYICVQTPTAYLLGCNRAASSAAESSKLCCQFLLQTFFWLFGSLDVRT